MRRFWPYSVVFVAWVALLPAFGHAEESLKLGYVDLQKALTQSEPGKRAKERFQTEVTRLQGSLEKQKTEIDKLKQEIEKKASVLREEERRNMEREYQRKFTGLQQDYKDSQAELQQKDNELTGEILRDLSDVIQEIGKRDGYTMILERANGVLLYSNSSIDLTDKVIASYNAKQAEKVRKKK